MDRLSPLAGVAATRQVLEAHGLATKHALGQNFLINDDILRKVVALAELSSHDYVLEVGSGIGTLTIALLTCAGRVVSIERDRDLPAVLGETLASWRDRFTLIEKDALDFELADLPEPLPQVPGAASSDGTVRAASGDGGAVAGDGPLRCVEAAEGIEAAEGDVLVRRPALKSGAAAAGGGLFTGGDSSQPLALPNKFVANLPYAVAATIVLDYLQRFESLESATVMVQKEVADRMTARPGTKSYGAYTVKLGLYARTAGRFPVSPGNFFPPPHVDSAVLRLDRVIARDDRGNPLSAEVLKATCAMADAAFTNRRKTLANSCKAYFSAQRSAWGISSADMAALFDAAKVDVARRGETFDQAEFVRLGKALLAVAEQAGR